MVSRPPSGMASRALMQRLSSAFSSWFGSTSVVQRPAAPTTSTSIARAHGAADQLLHARNQTVGVGRLGVERLLPREGQRAGASASRRVWRHSARRDDVAVEVIEAALADARLQQSPGCR